MKYIFPQMFVIRDTPAEEALKRLCKNGGAKPGQITCVSSKELESLRKDVEYIYPKAQGTK